MRKFPHKPDLEWIKTRFTTRLLDSYKEDIAEKSEHNENRNFDFFKACCDEAIEIACCYYAFEETDKNVKEKLNEASLHAEKAVEFGYPLDPGIYNEYLVLALLAEQSDFYHKLANLKRQDFTDPTVKCDELSYLASEAIAALVSGSLDLCRTKAQAGLARIESGAVNNLVKEAKEALLMMVLAIADQNQHALDAGIIKRVEVHIKDYKTRDGRNYAIGLLDINGLGWLKLAQMHGMEVKTDSVYLPLQFIR